MVLIKSTVLPAFISARAASGKSEGNTEVRLDVTYYETMGSFKEDAQKEEEAEGNDLSVLTNWNEQ
jgi:hypothetical protein